MSEDQDRSALDLLDRADGLAPPMVVEPDAVIARGRRKLRRRRLSAATGVGTAALVGTLWLGGPLNPFAAPREPAPASVSWQEGVSMPLFTVDPVTGDGPLAGRWVGELRSDEGEVVPELLLTRDGQRLDPVRAEDGPGDVLVYRQDGLAVAVWTPPPGSLGETPSWSPGSVGGQLGTAQHRGTIVRYAVAEYSSGESGALEELYWYDATAAHAVSGEPVQSAVLRAEGGAGLVMIDEERGVWGATPLTGHAGPHPVQSLVGGAGYTGWTGMGHPPTYIGVLPAEADLLPLVGPGRVVSSPLGSMTAVMSADASGTTAPLIRFELGGREHTLDDYVGREAVTLDVAGVPVTVLPTVDGIQLVGDEGVPLAGVPTLDPGIVTAVRVDGGYLLVVPGWDTTFLDTADVRVRLSGREDEWVTPADALSIRLEDRRPVTLVSLAPDDVPDGGRVTGVGADDGGRVTTHPLPETVVEVDADL